jgi:hypothetical protein
MWFDNLFDSGLTFSAPEIWGKMQEAVCLLERRDNPSAKGIDLKAIASDYDLLEQIFISKRWRYDELGDKVYLDSDNFKGCDLAYLHRFSPTRILESALKVAEEIKAKREREAAKLSEMIWTLSNQSDIAADSDRTIEQRVVESYSDKVYPPDEQTAFDSLSKLSILDDDGDTPN